VGHKKEQFMETSAQVPGRPPFKRPWFKASWLTVALLIVFFPIGLVLMWAFRSWKIWVKGLISAFFGLVVIVSAASNGSGSSSAVAAVAGTMTPSAASQSIKAAAAPVVTTQTSAPPTATLVPPTHVPPTATPVPPTATPKPPTATPVPPSATAAPNKASAVAIDPRRLGADPTSFIGQNIVLTGLARNVQQYDKSEKLFGIVRPNYTWTDFVSEVPGRLDVTQDLVAYWFPKNPDILKSNVYRIWAIVRGTEEATIILTGATQEVPDVEVYAYADMPNN
jgi:hypothetical protein